MVIFHVARYNRKEGNVLFNNAFNTFCLQLYSVRHMVKKHSYTKRKPAATNTWAILFIWHQRFFYMHHPTDRIVHIMALFYTNRGALAGTRNSSMGLK